MGEVAGLVSVQVRVLQALQRNVHRKLRCVMHSHGIG
jgi:hypothetical protein